MQFIEEFLGKIEFYLGKKATKQKKVEGALKTLKDYHASQKSVQFVPFSELTTGVNNAIVCGQILFVVNSKHFLPLTVILGDHAGNFFACSIYNVAPDVIKIGDILQVKEACVKQIVVEYREKVRIFIVSHPRRNWNILAFNWKFQVQMYC